MGKVHLKFRRSQLLSDQQIPVEQVSRELQILDEAVRTSKEQILVARSKVAKEVGDLEASIFDAHLAILEDRAFLGKVRDELKRDLKPVEVVISLLVEGYYQAMSLVKNEHLRARAADIRDVGSRLLENVTALKGRKDEVEDTLDQMLTTGDIVFSRELLPSDIAFLERRHVSAVITEAGSNRGHCAIMLRAMGVPTVMGIEGLATILRDGDMVVVDGGSGVVLVNPRAELIKEYRKTQDEFARYRELLDQEVNLPAMTTDGHRVNLMANINKLSEIELAKLHRMDGIGLYRTEFQLMVRDDLPDEEEQFHLYQEVVQQAGDQPITIRTIDIGADKTLSYLNTGPTNHSALGRRSIRMAFEELQEFQLAQLRAILRVAHLGNVRLMFPFITTIEDIRAAKKLVRLALTQLEERGQPAQREPPLGMMVEVPAAALSLDKFAREVAFFSVGTNDLVQYSCAADRNLPEVAAWYKGYNPGVLALLKIIVDTAKAHQRPVTVCGEMAGDPIYTMFLVGLGVDELSMSAPQMPIVKKVVRSIHLDGAERLANRALQLGSLGQIRELFLNTVERILGRDLSSWTKEA